MEKAIGRRDVFALVWLGAVLLVVAQGALQRELAGATPDPRWLLEWRVLPILIWAAASPWILDLGARLPFRGAAAARDLAIHAAVACGWVYASNVLMRLPGVVAGDSWASLPADAFAGAVRFAPGAVALYATLVLVGRGVASHTPRAAENGRARAKRESDTAGEPPAGVPGRASGNGMPDARRAEAAPAPTAAGASVPERLALRDGLHIHLVPRREVRWVEADSDHVRVHTSERSVRVRGTMRAFERELARDGFLRIHRSALIHPRAVREIQPYFHGDYVAVLDDGTELRIPRTRRAAIDALLAAAPLQDV